LREQRLLRDVRVELQRIVWIILAGLRVVVAARWEAAAAASSQSSKGSGALKGAADNRGAEGGSGPGRRKKLSGAALYSTEG